MAVVGLLAGIGDYVKSPHSYQASASVLLTLTPYENPLTAVNDNQAITKTSAVAGLAVHQLGLQQSVSSFLNTYTATSVTDRLLTITASAASANQAVLQASALGSAFLKFRADDLKAQNNLVLESLDQQINQAKQRVNSIGAQISQLPTQPASPTQQSQLGRLRAEQTSATATLSSLQQAVAGNQSTTQPAMTAALDRSQVLSVTPVPYSKKKKLITYGALGLLGGLAVGLTIVIVRALVSDRLRRRDDVAYALDAPVRLSVSTLGARRTTEPRPGRAAKRNLDMKRVIAYLHTAVPRSTQGPAGLAIVAVDNAPVVARAVADWPRPTPARALRSLRLIFPAALTWRTCWGSRALESKRSAATARTLRWRFLIVITPRPLVLGPRSPRRRGPREPETRWSLRCLRRSSAHPGHPRPRSRRGPPSDVGS